MAKKSHTSLAAYYAMIESGKHLQVRAKVVKALIERGPLSDDGLKIALPDIDIRSLSTRRLELCHAKTVGYMGYNERRGGEGNEMMVWGLIERHGAAVYFPPDVLEVRLRGNRTHLEFKSGELAGMDELEVGTHVHGMIEKLLIEEFDEELSDA